jgi:hypothetical protein
MERFRVEFTGSVANRPCTIDKRLIWNEGASSNLLGLNVLVLLTFNFDEPPQIERLIKRERRYQREPKPHPTN